MPIPTVLTQDYHYNLPQSKIAQRPLSIRDESKLLIYKHGEFKSDSYKHISNYLPANALMIFNNSKVIPARLIYIKETSGIIELFCLEPLLGTPYEALQHQGSTRWICMIGGLKKWQTKQALQWRSAFNQEILLSAQFIQAHEHGFEIEFTLKDESKTFAEKLDQLGQMPIPPYLLRKAESEDAVRYQTLYATVAGSVAAPTAGLHFTQSVLDEISNKNIKQVFATLHVGAGTFKPISTQYAHEHLMHAEWIEADMHLIQSLANFEDIICVGTTSLRTIESLYWYAILSLEKNELQHNDFVLPQFIAYDGDKNMSKYEAFNSLLHLMQIGKVDKIIFKTELMILPGYHMKVASHLVTNFHQPQSTLLMLVDAFTKGNWKDIYNYALENEFRFLSYGDGCLLSYADK